MSPAPTLSSITPSAYINSGTLSITNLAGTNFLTGATVKLTLTDNPDINATSVVVVSSIKITCTVNLANVQPGTYTVHVTNTDTQTATLNYFTVYAYPPTVVGMNAYQNVDGTAILYWASSPFYSTINSLTWTIKTDLVPTFDSGALVTYPALDTGDTNYIDGNVYKGYVITLPARAENATTTLYWEVRSEDPASGFNSLYSTGTFTILPAMAVTTANSMLASLPDIIYKKDMS